MPPKNVLVSPACYRDGAELMAQPTTLWRWPQARAVARAAPAARGPRLLREMRLVLWVLVRASVTELLFLACACWLLAWSAGRAGLRR